MSSFPCTSCGICCKKLGLVLSEKNKLPKDFQEDLRDFPYKANLDGSCEKLVDGMCSVYNNRPDLCNIETRYNKHYSSFMTKEEFFEDRAMGCQTLIIKDKEDLRNIPWIQ